MRDDLFDIILDTIEANQPFSFKDGKFNFYKIIVNSLDPDSSLILRVRDDVSPRDAAVEKGILQVIEIIPAKHDEILLWMEAHHVELYNNLLYITEISSS